MAIKLINATPISSGSELQLPGAPLVFGLRSTRGGFVRAHMLYAELGYTNFFGQTFTDPREDEELLKKATVAYRAPEHADSGPPKAVDVTPFGDDVICRLVGNGNATSAGVFEVSVPIENPLLPVMASVTFRLSDAWYNGANESQYWCNLDSVLPLYAGLEFGAKNTGIFACLRDDGANGSMVVGGPLQTFGAARPHQMELPLAAWKECAFNSGLYSIFFAIDPETLLVKIWKKAVWGIDNELGDTAPVQIGNPIPLDALGVFRQKGTSESLTAYFGHGGATGTVSVVDFAIYRFFSPAAIFGEAYNRHHLSQTPDLPLVYRSSCGVLPTGPVLGKWLSSEIPPVARLWFQPGRKTSPLYTEIVKSGDTTSFITREDLRLSRDPIFQLRGFSVEAWLGGTAATGLADKGFGIRVTDGVYGYRVTAIEADARRTYGVERVGSDPTDASTYFIPRIGSANVTALTYPGTPVRELDYTGLRMVRLTYNKTSEELSLFVENPDDPVLVVPRAISVAFPYPGSSEPGSIAIGHFVTGIVNAQLNLAASSISTDYAAWEKRLGAPDSLGNGELFEAEGNGNNTPPDGNGSPLVWDNDTGTFTTPPPPGVPQPIGNVHIWRAMEEFTYFRGFQVDFRAVVTSVVPPNTWTGVGVTVYLGNSESPARRFKQVHVGFFDCGIHGRRVGIVTADSVDEILRQTLIGRKYSAPWEWGPVTGPDDQRNLRVVYRPYQSVEVWDSTLLKGSPIISIPWKDFIAEDDPDVQDPSIAFGAFNPDFIVTAEWDYVRWGIAAGTEVSIAQDIVLLPDTQGGKLLLKLSSGEHLDLPGDGHNPSVYASINSVVSASDSMDAEFGAAAPAMPSVEAVYVIRNFLNTYNPTTGAFTSSALFPNTPNANEVFLLDINGDKHAGTYSSSSLITFPAGIDTGGTYDAQIMYLIYSELTSQVGSYLVPKSSVESSTRFRVEGANFNPELTALRLRDEIGTSMSNDADLNDSTPTAVVFHFTQLTTFAAIAYVRVTSYSPSSVYNSETGSGLHITFTA